jgi:mono/diheme cytochrome c family protein
MNAISNIRDKLSLYFPLVTAAFLMWTTASVRCQEDAGKRAYVQAGCDSCHGPDAKGTGQAPELAGLKRTFAEFERIVREGVGEMPAHSKDELSDAQLAGIYKWLVAPTSKGRGRTRLGSSR